MECKQQKQSMDTVGVGQAADEKKKLPNVALLPDVGNQANAEWSEQEYLGLYPRIGVHKPKIKRNQNGWFLITTRTQEPSLVNGSSGLTSRKLCFMSDIKLNIMNDYQNPLSIYFVRHPLDKELIYPVFAESFACLRRDVDRPFSRSVNVPFLCRRVKRVKFLELLLFALIAPSSLLSSERTV